MFYFFLQLFLFNVIFFLISENKTKQKQNTVYNFMWAVETVSTNNFSFGHRLFMCFHFIIFICVCVFGINPTVCVLFIVVPSNPLHIHLFTYTGLVCIPFRDKGFWIWSFVDEIFFWFATSMLYERRRRRRFNLFRLLLLRFRVISTI